MIKRLLDTHALLWLLEDDHRMPDALRNEIDADPGKHGVSDACLWEIAIKRALGKLAVPDDLPAVLDGLGFRRAAITREHVWAVRDLPHHHRDPFDRLLIAQARDHRVPIVTADPAFGDYEVAVDW